MLRILRPIYDAIRAHGEQTYPRECCGALLGKRSKAGWYVEQCVETGNMYTDLGHNHYQISPLDLMGIERKSRELGLEIAGFYHSHPDHPAQWSQSDISEAHWIGCSYAITAVEHGKAILTKSFTLTGTTEETKQFEPETIEIVDVS